jgi:hypothetical protein
MHVVVAEQRSLPAAERVEGHRYGDRHVNAHMPAFTRLLNTRAASPSRVKIAVPLPYSCSFTRLSANSKSVTRTTDSTVPKISSRILAVQNAGPRHRGGIAANVFSMFSSTASVERTPASR